MNLTDENLITDIISRVPAKDLMRFMSVSKSWHSLIDSDSYLASFQLQRTASSDRPSLLFWIHRDRTNGWPHYFIWLDLDEPENMRKEIHDPLHDDHDPRRGDLIVYDSCHGLLVLRDGRDGGRPMAVSNPTTKKYHIVPPNPVAIFIGFGYDYSRCCYKLVSIVSGGDHDHVLELMIYDVIGAGNEWRKIRCDVLELMTYADNEWVYPNGAYVDGALYWYLKSRAMIIGFDLAEEKFFETALPDFGDDVVYDKIWIEVFDEHLCLLCDRNNRRRKVDFWVMDKKCDDGSWNWTKFLTMTPPGRDKVLQCRGDPRLFPICFSDCRNKILFDVYSQEVWWYEPKTKEFRKLKCPEFRKGTCFRKTSCIRSLIGNGIF